MDIECRVYNCPHHASTKKICELESIIITYDPREQASKDAVCRCAFIPRHELGNIHQIILEEERVKLGYYDNEEAKVDG